MLNIRRLELDLKAMAKGRSKKIECLPHKDDRPPAESIRTPSYYSQGYLDAFRHGACPLIVENDRPVLLMHAEDARRQVDVFRWNLASFLNNPEPRAVEGPLPEVTLGGASMTKRCHAMVIPWPIHPFPLPLGGGPPDTAEQMVQFYRFLR